MKDYKELGMRDINDGLGLAVHLLKEGYKFLGWQGEPAKTEEMKKCRELGHTSGYKNSIIQEISHSMTGYYTTYWCPVCKIYWKIDSSG